VDEFKLSISAWNPIKSSLLSFYVLLILWSSQPWSSEIYFD